VACRGYYFTAAAVRTAEGSFEVCLTKDDLLNVISNWTEMRTTKEMEGHRVRWNLPGSIFFAATIVTTIGKLVAYSCN